MVFIKKLKQNEFFLSGKKNILLTHMKTLNIDGEIYYNNSYIEKNFDFDKDFKKFNENKKSFYNWRRIIWDLKKYFNIKYLLYSPNSLTSLLPENYSENEVINSFMTLYNDGFIKLKGVSFHNGKSDRGHTYKDMFLHDIFRYNYISIPIYNYGWNNSIDAIIELKYLFNYNVNEIIKRCDYKEYIRKYIPENYKEKNINDIMLKIFKDKILYKNNNKKY